MTNHRHGDQSGGVMDIREVLRDMPEEFLDYIVTNYPGRTIISDPKWHAPKVWRAAVHAAASRIESALASLPAEAQGDGAVAAWRVVLDGTAYQWHNAPPPIFPPDKGRIEYAYTQAATPAVKVPSGWQTISTAPMDGTRVDLWVEEGYRIPNRAFEHHDWLNGRPTRPKSWFAPDPDGPTPTPTHWMPLPAAPTVSAQKGEG